MSNEDKERDELMTKLTQRWKKKLKEVREYEVSDTQDKQRAGVISSGTAAIHPGDFRQAEGLKRKLLKQYKGKTLDGVFSGKVLNTPNGICYHIESRFKIEFKMMAQQRVKEHLLSSLKLVYGVGDVTEPNLRSSGYLTIKDLVEHPVYKSRAQKCLNVLEGDDCAKLSEMVGHWYSASHPLSLFTSGFHNKEDFVFFDLETMGLFSRPVILFGLAKLDGNEIVISQFLLRDFNEEPAALHGFMDHITPSTALVTFNGKSFDVPYLEERLAFYGLKGNLRLPHFDMLHFSRRAWRGKFQDCTLGTLEKHLFGVQRVDDVPGALVPDFYELYINTKNIGPLVPIIEHNKQDLVSLAKIFSKLHEVWGNG